MALAVQISSYEELEKVIQDSEKEYDQERIRAAYQLAVEKHGDQKRSSGEPYIIHPLSVAAILVGLGMDSESVMAGLLHDVVEDTDVPLEEIRKRFGSEVALLVAAEKGGVSRQELLRSALIGLVFGCYDGLVGPGTGTFMILGFTALLSLDLITAGGCAKASNLASCAASAVVWILHGQVLWALAIPALACSIAGNYLGALYAIRGGSKKIRSVMFLVLGLLFVKMLYELLF